MTAGAATVLICTLTCPQCGYQCAEEMPTDACVYFYECTHCHALIKPLPGDCCVFCSYGTVACPPQQRAGECCRC
ncbi:MAG TPA: GDCCVxC domain-containing (seleno)protein [Gammaproteobacteria bacterium]|nr:GDCCVxC domain-containing (seleno)protein [Gammaproteobacteria bacterium]